MKTLKFCLLVSAIVFLAFNSPANSQTFQFDLSAKCTNALVLCVADRGLTVSGEWTYHFTYHLDKRGKLEWIHWNVSNYDLHIDGTDEELIIIDTGHDNLNNTANWDFWNTAYSYNLPYGIEYNVVDGWMNLPPNPDEGTNTGTLKIRTKSGIQFASLKMVFQLHRNAKGMLTADVAKYEFECY